MPDRGAVLLLLALALDAVDPRLPADQREAAAATAMEVDPALAASAWAGMLAGMLMSLRDQLGAPALDEVMRSMASAASMAAGVVGAAE